MRISEEVDALEVMAIPSLPFLVTTRIIAGLIAVTPLYVVGLLSSYFATRLTVTRFFGQSAGTYDHYFNQFLPPGDVLWSFGKVLIFSVVVILIHCYHGYNASRRSRRRRRRGRPRRPHVHRRDQRHRPVPVDGDLGHHDHRQAGGLAAMATQPGRSVSAARPSTGCWAWRSWCCSRCSAGLTYAIFNKSFVSYDDVTLRDLQDRPPAAEPGGREDPRRAGGRGARPPAVRRRRRPTSRSASTRASAHIIPANVTARILPKTLFGEKYVALQVPRTRRRGASGRGT